MIVITLPGTEHMHDNVAIIQQHPPGIQGAFLMMGNNARLFQAIFDFVMNGTKLSFTVTGTNNKIVRKAAYFAGIQ